MFPARLYAGIAHNGGGGGGGAGRLEGYKEETQVPDPPNRSRRSLWNAYTELNADKGLDGGGARVRGLRRDRYEG